MPGPDQERYTGLLSVKDPTTRRVLKVMMDRLNTLEGQVVDLGRVTQPLATPMDAGTQRITTLADPTAEADAVNFRTLKRYVAAAIALNAAPVPPRTGEEDEGDEGSNDNGEGQSGCLACGVDGHPTPGLTLDNYTAGLIVCGVGQEFPALLLATANQPARDANSVELLERMIWHLQLYGYPAGRQRNPSGVISLGKLTVQISSVWWAYDIAQHTADYTLALVLQMSPVTPADPVATAGIAD